MGNAAHTFPPVKALPCPFCGNDIVAVKSESTDFLTEYCASVHCAECDTQGPWTYRYSTEEGAMRQAVAKWNARAAIEVQHG